MTGAINQLITFHPVTECVMSLNVMGIYVFSMNGDTPKWMVYSGKSKKKLDDLGVPPCQETSVWGYNGIYNVFWVYFLWASGSCPRAGPTVHTDGNPASARSGGPLWKAEVMVAYIYIYIIIEGSLEVKLPTVWTVEKQR